MCRSISGVEPAIPATLLTHGNDPGPRLVTLINGLLDPTLKTKLPPVGFESRIDIQHWL